MTADTKIRRSFCLFRSNSDGAVAVEYALVSLLFFTTLFMTIESARLFWAWNSLQSGVEKSARYYLTHTSAQDDELETYITDHMTDMYVDTSNLNVAVTKETVNGVNFIQIDGTYVFDMLGYCIPGGAVSITLTSSTRLPTGSSSS